MISLPINSQQASLIFEQMPRRERQRLLTNSRLATEQEPPSPILVDEILSFLAAGPSQQQIANFQISERSQARLDELLDKNGEDELTESEEIELDMCERVYGLISLLTARARRGA